ncbi:MAG: sigma 54-interacting transcriptional regulator [Myxococcota bacterium]
MADATLPSRQIEARVHTLRVVVTGGPDKGLEKEVRLDRIAIGTARDNDLVLRDETVSRYHLELTHTGTRIDVKDLGSTNGTIAGPVRIREATVEPRTTLQLGNTSIQVEEGETFDVPLVGGDRLSGLVGRSTATRRMVTEIDRVARSDVSVLIQGETGSGKEVVARTIHAESGRSRGPFETVDCGALTPTLTASELFGHEKGAFTGADARHIGAFERADGGTLFLDEIGELPANLQTALLGVLERRSFKRVGGDKPIQVDVRVLSATHRDLRSQVNSGNYRQDLYYRLAVVGVRVPPLRERIEDIPELMGHFLQEMGLNQRVEELFPKSALNMLERHSWPGNVRELRNFVEASVAMGQPPELDESAPRLEGGPLPHFKDARAQAIHAFEKTYLRALLAQAQENVSEAARLSDINRSYLNEMLKRHGLR